MSRGHVLRLDVAALGWGSRRGLGGRRPARSPVIVKGAIRMDIDEITARLERAAAEAPTIRSDGSFVITAQGRCRVCGCTDERACAGGCIWAEPNLCSRC